MIPLQQQHRNPNWSEPRSVISVIVIERPRCTSSAEFKPSCASGSDRLKIEGVIKHFVKLY